MQGFPALRYEQRNGILLVSILHFEFHKSVRKPKEITPLSFLKFCQRLQNDDEYLILCLNNITAGLQKRGYFDLWRPKTIDQLQLTVTDKSIQNSDKSPRWLIKSLQRQLLPEDLLETRSQLRLLITDLKTRIPH